MGNRLNYDRDFGRRSRWLILREDYWTSNNSARRFWFQELFSWLPDERPGVSFCMMENQIFYIYGMFVIK